MDDLPAQPVVSVSSPKLSLELVQVLACPLDHSDLGYDEVNNRLTCTKCQTIFPIVNGIPNMLVQENSVSEPK